MLAPKRLKFRKKQRGHFRGVATTCNTIVFGEFGLVAAETLWITNRQIEAARVAMTRHIKRGGKVWIFNGEIFERNTKEDAGVLVKKNMEKKEGN